MVTVAPAVFVHPERFGPVKSGPNRLFVLHTTEGGEGTDSAEQLASFVARRGDRTTASGSSYGSSYHYVIDTDRVIPLVPENTVSYSAPGANNDGIHIVFPGKANQLRNQWLDDVSMAYLRNCADLLKQRSTATGIPLRELTVTEVRAGMAGYCDHWTISQAYGRTDHTDVGKFFPWDVLEQLLQPPAPEEDDDMKTARLWRDKRYKNAWLIGAGPALHLSQQVWDSYVNDGIPQIVQDPPHEYMLTACLTQSGLDRSKLLPA